MTTPDDRQPTIEPTASAMDVGALETVYDLLAEAIDTAGPEHSERFLVKLALLNAQALGDVDRFRRHLQAALLDL
ncbi:MAG: DUF2783 domain-containing protein [Aquabacterium sp.]